MNESVAIDELSAVAEPLINVIEFNPPIQVNPLIISGNAVVDSAVIQSQPDPTQVIASISGTGFAVPLVIGVPFVTDDETSLRTYLS
jgi:hypothetical protein